MASCVGIYTPKVDPIQVDRIVRRSQKGKEGGWARSLDSTEIEARSRSRE